MGNGFSLKSDIVFYFTIAFCLVSVVIFLVATLVVVGVAEYEHPNKPIRAWISVSFGMWFFTSMILCFRTETHTENDTIVSEERGANPVVLKIALLVCVTWWAVGLYWMISGGDSLLDRAPILFWYTAVILGLAAVAGVILCCLFSCMICCVNGTEAYDNV